MQRLIFNPWNDLALASGSPHYTPPASARQMAADLAHLPSLWDIDPEADVLLPWGWSPLLVAQLRAEGEADSRLPSAGQLAAYRAASSRHTAVCLLARLRAEWPEAFAEGGPLVGESMWCQTEAEVLAALAAYGGKAMLKAPWSGSGRGVKKEMSLSPWVHRVLRTQGGVEAEPLYAKVEDLAMEFWAGGGQVRYEGLSLFTTTDGGVYAGNLVATEQEKERRLAQYIDLRLLHDLRQRLECLLSDGFLPAWYTGPLGIDMMIVGKGFLHPLVELNLRMTMGWVACRLTHRLPEGSTGLFRIALREGRYHADFSINEVQK